MKNLILTIVHGYDYPFIEPFFKSLKEAGVEADLVIFISETVSRATRRAMEKAGATLIRYNSTYPFKPEYAEYFKDILPSASISNYRFVLYRAFLLNTKEQYNQIMLTDIRDVIFQRNPFDILKGRHINVFLEDPGQTFRSSELNYQWSSAANGQAETDTMIDNVVSCAGITIGECSLILNYTGHITNKLKNRDDLPWAFDQGIHNGYVHLVKPAGLRVFTNDDPVVSTLGAYQPFKSNSKNEVVNSKGEAYAVVHQYDRARDLFGAIKNKYIGNRLTQRLKRLYYLLMP